MKNKNNKNLPDPAADNPPPRPDPVGSAFKIDITYDPKVPRGQNNPGISISPIGGNFVNVDDALDILLILRDNLVAQKTILLSPLKQEPSQTDSKTDGVKTDDK